MFSTNQDKNALIGAGVGTTLSGPIGGTIGGAVAKPVSQIINKSKTDPLTGAAAGATLGSVVPGIGTALGGLVGGIRGALGGSKAKKAAKQQQQLALLAAMSANNYKKDVNGAANKLAKDSSIMDQSGMYANNEDLLEGLQNAYTDAYNKNTLLYSGGDNVYKNYLDDLKNSQQATWQRDFNNMFSGYGTTNDYLDDLWNMNAANDFNQKYLNDYYNDTLSKLDSAKSRGLLNDAGYNSALDTLNQRNSAAGSGVRDLTNSVLTGYRDDWANLAGNIQTGIDNYSLGQRNMNLGEKWNNQYNDLYGRQQQGFEGDLNNALSGYTPYDVSDILANARNSQGVMNPQATDDSELLAAMQEKQSNKNKVGLGNQGIF